jgi:hypothetical protein
MKNLLRKDYFQKCAKIIFDARMKFSGKTFRKIPGICKFIYEGHSHHNIHLIT